MWTLDPFQKRPSRVGRCNGSLGLSGSSELPRLHDVIGGAIQAENARLDFDRRLNLFDEHRSITQQPEAGHEPPLARRDALYGLLQRLHGASHIAAALYHDERALEVALEKIRSQHADALQLTLGRLEIANVRVGLAQVEP